MITIKKLVSVIFLNLFIHALTVLQNTLCKGCCNSRVTALLMSKIFLCYYSTWLQLNSLLTVLIACVDLWESYIIKKLQYFSFLPWCKELPVKYIVFYLFVYCFYWKHQNFSKWFKSFCTFLVNCGHLILKVFIWWGSYSIEICLIYK